MIKIYMRYNDSTHTHYYNEFEKIKRVPKIGELFL